MTSQPTSEAQGANAAKSPAEAKLEEILRQQGVDNRTVVHQAFDTDSATQTRASYGPRTTIGQETGLGEHYAKIAQIELDLVEYAKAHGRFTADFKRLLTDDNLTFGERLRLGFYTLLQQKKNADDIVVKAAQRKGTLLEEIVNEIGKVFDEQHQTAIKGVGQAKQMQVQNLGYMKAFDRKIIDSLRASYRSGQGYEQQQQEVDRLEKELSEIQNTLEMYETEMQKAKDAGNLDRLGSLTNDVMKLLNVKSDVLDGKYAGEGSLQETRRKMLDAAEGVQSARGALAASRVNYLAINSLIDTYSKLEIKYRHARSDMIPVFKIQAQVAASGRRAGSLRDSLLKAAELSNRLMEANEGLVMAVGKAVQDLMQTPLFDVQHTQEIEGRLQQYMTQMAQIDREWAENAATLNQGMRNPLISNNGGYAQPS